MLDRTLMIGFAAAFAAAASGCSSGAATATSQPQAAGPALATFAANGASPSSNVVPCGVRDVRLKPTGDSSDFNGMSHSGTYLALTNRSHNACSIPGLPQLTFLDANGPVKTTADLPGTKFMHPGPVVLPMVLQPKQTVTTSARWVSGPVFQDNLCYKLTGVTLALRNESTMTPLAGQMCGERSKGVHYDLQRYGANTKQ